MRRTLIRIAAASALVLSMTAIAAAVGSEARPDGWRDVHCRYARLDGQVGWTDYEVRRAIRCSVERWNVPGGVRGATCIAEEESGLDESALNPSGAGGVYQWLEGTFAGAYSSHPGLVQHWQLHNSRLNARSAIVLAIRWAHDNWSWQPWNVRFECGLA